jgi:endonuclease G
MPSARPDAKRTGVQADALLLLAAIAVLGTTSAATARESEIHTFHCLNGCPVGAPATNDLIVREIYTLSSNDLTRLADWVAYRVTKESIGQSGDREWRADPWLAGDETLRPGDYDAASDVLHVDRGHQAPLASFSGTPSAADTNVLSNITPQSSALNQGPWVRLEAEERSLAQRLAVPVYVLTGPLFERMMRPLPGTTAIHRVPSGYWKVVALGDGRATAFVFDQADARKKDHCSARVTLQHVQLRARLFLFPDALATPAPLDSELGCPGAALADPAPAEIPVEPRTLRKHR